MQNPQPKDPNAKSLSQYLNDLIGSIKEKTAASFVVFSSFDTSEQVMRVLAENEIPFQVALGRYNSEYETSYVISIDDLVHVISLGITDGQESFLVAGEDDHAYLVFNELNPDASLRIESLGKLTTISKEEADKAEAWTFDPNEGIYWGTAS